jgi:hypothetical protein
VTSYRQQLRLKLLDASLGLGQLFLNCRSTTSIRLIQLGLEILVLTVQRGLLTEVNTKIMMWLLDLEHGMASCLDFLQRRQFLVHVCQVSKCTVCSFLNSAHLLRLGPALAFMFL